MSMRVFAFQKKKKTNTLIKENYSNLYREKYIIIWCKKKNLLLFQLDSCCCYIYI